jgi:hypothetical protein
VDAQGTNYFGHSAAHCGKLTKGARQSQQIAACAGADLTSRGLSRQTTAWAIPTGH